MSETRPYELAVSEASAWVGILWELCQPKVPLVIGAGRNVRSVPSATYPRAQLAEAQVPQQAAPQEAPAGHASGMADHRYAGHQCAECGA